LNLKKRDMKNLKKIIILIVMVAVSNIALADKWKGEVNPMPNQRVAGCEPARTSTELAIINVRALIHTGGDMWWDLQGTQIMKFLLVVA
jgi:uncharacterized protein YpmB